jgi:hypothetical protein
MVGNAMGELRRVVPTAASYVSESNFFEKDWQRSYWGANYGRCWPSRAGTTGKDCFLSIAVSAARTGAWMALKRMPRINRARRSKPS